jgi:hypothetical protein
MQKVKERHTISEESIKRLNEENLARELENQDMMKAIEKQVNTYLASITRRDERDQLSKPQLINSHKKTWEWLTKVRENEQPSPVVPEEFLKLDYDPVLYDPNTPLPVDEPIAHPGLSKLTGEAFMENILPQCSFAEEEMEVKQVRMKDWLLERQGKLAERDKVREWMRQYNYDENDFESHVAQWQVQHPHLSQTQWLEIYKLKPNSLLSTNELLCLYKSEVPSAMVARQHHEPRSQHSGRHGRNQNHSNDHHQHSNSYNYHNRGYNKIT